MCTARIHLFSEFREVFRYFDKNNDGHITVSELATIAEACGRPKTEGELRAMIRQVDKNSKLALLGGIQGGNNYWDCHPDGCFGATLLVPYHCDQVSENHLISFMCTRSSKALQGLTQK